MRRMKSYFRMKYEQLMMRMFDRIVKIMIKDPNLEWYVYRACRKKIEKLEWAIYERDKEIDKLYSEILNQYEQIVQLEEELEFYEPNTEE